LDGKIGGGKKSDPSGTKERAHKSNGCSVSGEEKKAQIYKGWDTTSGKTDKILRGGINLGRKNLKNGEKPDVDHGPGRKTCAGRESRYKAQQRNNVAL